jgi:hypothetical protein
VQWGGRLRVSMRTTKMVQLVRWFVGHCWELCNAYQMSWVQAGIHVGAALLHVVLGSPDGCYWRCKQARRVCVVAVVAQDIEPQRGK